MKKPLPRPAERCHPRLEIWATCIAMLFAPLAYLAVGFPLGLAFEVVTEVLGWSGIGELGAEGTIMLFGLGGGLIAYPLAWLVGLPVAIYLHATDRLSMWTVLVPSIATAWLALVPFYLLAIAKQDLASAAVTIVIASAIVVSGTIAVAFSFWGVYCFFTGHEFWSRWPWPRTER